MSSKRKPEADLEWEKDLAEEDKTPDPAKPQEPDMRRCTHCQQVVDASGRVERECAVCEGWMCEAECGVKTVRPCCVEACEEPIACVATLPRTNGSGRTCANCLRIFCGRHKRRCNNFCLGGLCELRLCDFCARHRAYCPNCLPLHMDRDNNNKNEQHA